MFIGPVLAVNSRHLARPVEPKKIHTILMKIMKISMIQILLTILALQFSWATPVRAQLMDKRISITFTDQNLEDAVKSLANQGSFRLVYSNQFINKMSGVNRSFRDVMIKDILESLLAANNLSYEVLKNRYVLIKAKSETAAAVLPQKDVNANGRESFVVIGKVSDENNEAMPGVSVKVKNGIQATVTDSKGNYAIGVSEPGNTIEFSFVGYRTQSLTVNKEATIDISMKPDPSKLDEILVIGYGTTTRRTSTGSQASITAKEIERQPVTNVLQALQGRMPGVTITQTNGLPGAGINVMIRGANSLDRVNRPFYVIDGVPFLSEPITAAVSGTGAVQSAEGQTSPMNIINPADIESIEILKDADATAIYGSRGANGVVLITTKKGRAGKTQFSVNASTGASVVPHFIDLLKTEQYLALRRKGYANNPTVAPNRTFDPDLLIWDQNAYTDFPRLLLGKTAKTHDITSNISGGDVRTNFYLSGTYHQEGNVYPGEQGYKRGGANFNFNHSSYNQRFTVGLSALYTADQNNITATDLANFAYSLPPNYPLYAPNGSLYAVNFFNNPLAFLQQTNDARSSNFLTSLNLKYNILKGLDLKSSLGYSKTDSRVKYIRPLSSLNMSAFPVPTSGTANESYTYTSNYIFEPQLTYKIALWKGNLDLLAGGSWQFKQSNQPYNVSASDFLSDEFLSNIAAARNRVYTTSSSEFKYASVFARATYNVLNRYIANVSFRRDGSSRFGPNRRFGNFGSAGAAWIFSEEKFLKDKFKWFSFGKLRGSFGVIGNDEIGNYQYFDSYTSSPYIYNNSAGLQPSRIANNEFRWEQTKKLELGLELGFLNDRLSLAGSLYRNRTDNQLLTFPVSPQTGFAGFQSNLPALIENSGAELSLTSTNFKSKNFTWTSSFNISKNRNLLRAYPGIETTSYYSRFQVGNPINSSYLYQYTGVDPSTGLPAFADLNGNGLIGAGFAATGAGDRYYAGTTYPKYFGGLTNSLTYKGLNLDFTFQFVKQKGRSLLAASFYPPGYGYNAAASVVNDYLALGSQDQLVTAVANTTAGRAAYTAYSNYTVSDASLVDASFIRMKNASLSYNFPTKWTSKISAQNFRIYLQGQNLFTITNYGGYDPESQGVGTPPLRTITAGLQCTF